MQDEPLSQDELSNELPEGVRRIYAPLSAAEFGHILTKPPDWSLRFLYENEVLLTAFSEEEGLGFVRNIIAMMIAGRVEDPIYTYSPVNQLRPANIIRLLKPDTFQGELRFEDTLENDADGPSLKWDPLGLEDEEKLIMLAQQLYTPYLPEVNIPDRPYDARGERVFTPEDVYNLNGLFRSVLYSILEPDLIGEPMPFTDEMLRGLDVKYSAIDRKYVLKIWDKWYVVKLKTSEVPNVANLDLRGFEFYCSEATPEETELGEAIKYLDVARRGNDSYARFNPDLLKELYRIVVEQPMIDTINEDKWPVYAMWGGESPSTRFAILIIDPKTRRIAKKLIYRLEDDGEVKTCLPTDLHIFQYNTEKPLDEIAEYYVYRYRWDRKSSNWRVDGIDGMTSSYKRLGAINIPEKNFSQILFTIAKKRRGFYLFRESNAWRVINGKDLNFITDPSGYMVEYSPPVVAQGFPHQNNVYYRPKEKTIVPFGFVTGEGAWDKFQLYYDV